MHVFPNSLLTQLNQGFSIDAERFLISQNQPPKTSIRFNINKILNFNQIKDFVNFSIQDNIPWIKNGFYIKNTSLFVSDPLWHGGAYYVQEASSMFLDYVLKFIKDSIPASSIIFDACAAPGGKTTILVDNFPDVLIHANEFESKRAHILIENINKWGGKNVMVTNNDTLQCNTCSINYNLILVDAPCSGSGLFRKMPEFTSEWTEKLVQDCVIRQKKILNNVMPKVEDNGYLIYSTCSFSPEENEDILKFINQNDEWQGIQIPNAEAFGIVETRCQGGYGYRFFSHNLEGEGFFISVFKKRPTGFKIGHKISREVPVLNSTDFMKIIKSSNYFSHLNPQNLFQFEQFVILKNSYWSAIQEIKAKWNIVQFPYFLGHFEFNKFIPSYMMLTILNIETDQKLELCKKDALRYLKGETFEIDLQSYRKWVKVQYSNLDLGWIKIIDTKRWNNEYPKYWRIRMPLEKLI